MKGAHFVKKRRVFFCLQNAVCRSMPYDIQAWKAVVVSYVCCGEDRESKEMQ